MKNRLGIENDPEALRIDERDFTADRAEDVSEVAGKFDAQHLRDIHKHLFQDVYEWAGTMRSDTIELEGETINVPEHANILSKGDSSFLPATHLVHGLAHVEKLANSEDALSPDRETFAKAATEVLSDLNYAHPFREGNGRTQRAFVESLADRAGHELDFEGVTAARNNAASIEAHDGNTDALHQIISESLDPEKVELRLEAVEHLKSLGVNVQNSQIEVAESGQRIDGKFLSQDADSALFVDEDLNIVATPSEECPPGLEQDQRVDFVVGGTQQYLSDVQADLLDKAKATWADIEAMPEGAERDELTTNFKELAAVAVENGHPDEFFKDHIKGVEASKELNIDDDYGL